MATAKLGTRVRTIQRMLDSAALMRWIALASLAANVLLIGTGGAVRLSGSGLGCPTWPRCDEGSYVPTGAMGVHGTIEFANRTLTFLVGALAAACVAVAWARYGRSTPLWWALGVLLGIPAQAVVGGVTVLTDLNPWVVACHFLASIAVLAAAWQLLTLVSADRGDAPAGLSADATPAPPSSLSAPPGPSAAAHPLIQKLVWLIVGVTGAVLAVGAVVTGSGPHAGDAKARRTGLDPGMVAQLHADLVMLLVGLSVAAWFTLRAAARPAARAAVWLIVIEASQALVGFVQYFTHLPVALVDLHMVGAALVWVCALRLLTGVRGVDAPAPARSLAAPTEAPATAGAVQPAGMV